MTKTFIIPHVLRDVEDKEFELACYEYEYLQQHPHKNNDNKNRVIINQILKDNWNTYQYHKSELRDVEIEEVENSIDVEYRIEHRTGSHMILRNKNPAD